MFSGIKQFSIISICVVVGAMVLTKGNDEKPQVVTTSQAAPDDGWRSSAIAKIKAEPKVVDAMFPQRGSLWISTRDDGTRRDGYAEYFCVSLFQAGMKPGDFVVIHIWDAAAMAREKMVELGRFECARKA